MALQTKTYSTGSFDRNGQSRGYILDLILTEESVDTAANTSLVSYQLRLRSGSGNRFDWEMTAKLSLNGQQVAAKTQQKYLNYNSTWVLLSGQTTISHGTDGSKNMAFAASLAPYNGGNKYTPPSMSLSGSLALTAIPRETTIAAAAAYIESSATIAVNRKSTSYTHSIHYQFGKLSGYLQDATGTIGEGEKKLTATTIIFKIPSRFYEQIPNDPSGTCTLTCKTYSGTKQVGQTQTAYFTVTADPGKCKPTVTANAEDINTTTIALTGNIKKLVKGKSKLKCTVSATGNKSATIAAIYVNNKKITDSSYELDNVQTAAITVKAVDTRGYSAEYKIPDLTLVNYVPLSYIAQAKRTDPTDGNARLQVTGKAFSGSFGEKTNTLTAHYRIGSGDWQSFTPSVSGTNLTAQVNLSGLDYTRSHTLAVKISDSFGTVSKTVKISKGLPVFDWGENDFRFNVPVNAGAINSTYIRSIQLWSDPDPERNIRIQSRFSEWDTGYSRQSFFIFGIANSVIVYGVAVIRSNGSHDWSGTSGVTISAEENGIVNIQMPTDCYDNFTVISPQKFSFVA